MTNVCKDPPRFKGETRYRVSFSPVILTMKGTLKIKIVNTVYLDFFLVPWMTNLYKDGRIYLEGHRLWRVYLLVVVLPVKKIIDTKVVNTVYFNVDFELEIVDLTKVRWHIEKHRRYCIYLFLVVLLVSETLKSQVVVCFIREVIREQVFHFFPWLWVVDTTDIRPRLYVISLTNDSDFDEDVIGPYFEVIEGYQLFW